MGARMPETWWAWAGLGGIAYFWLGVARVAQGFSAPITARPFYAKAGGPHIFFYALSEPLALLFMPSVGGPGRVGEFVLAAAIHFGLTLLAFWLLGFLISTEWIRLAILGGLVFLFLIPFLIPGRNLNSKF